MACVCFLCEADVSSGAAVVKRKKLFGSAASKYITALDDIGGEVFERRLADLQSDVGLRELSEYICIGCCNSVDSLVKYLKKADDIKQSILRNLERVFKSYDDSQQQQCDVNSPSTEQVS